MQAFNELNAKCPHCERPLLMQAEGDLVGLWCGHGRCKSEVMKIGATAKDVASAFEILDRDYSQKEEGTFEDERVFE